MFSKRILQLILLKSVYFLRPDDVSASCGSQRVSAFYFYSLSVLMLKVNKENTPGVNKKINALMIYTLESIKYVLQVLCFPKFDECKKTRASEKLQNGEAAF